MARTSAKFPGYTRLSAQTLSSCARGIAGHLFGIDPYLVRVFLHDDSGYLAISINLPLSFDQQGRSMLHNARTQRPLLGEEFRRLTGALVSKIDIRITGVVATNNRVES